MQQYLRCFVLMMKRMIKKPAFLLFLLALPLLSVLITRLEREENGNTGIVAGILFEGEAQRETQDKLRAAQEWDERFLSLLTGTDSVIHFQQYDSRSAFEREIQKGNLDCGVIVPADIRERIMQDAWQGCIIIDTTSSSSMTEIVKERVAAALFTLYSEESYVNYIEQADVFYTDSTDIQADAPEIVSFAKEAYQTHLADGSTFAFAYHGGYGEHGEGYSMEAEAEANGTGMIAEADREGRYQAAQPTFRLRGILAVCIFLSGLCGLLTDWQDRQERRFVRILPNSVTTVVNVWIPTIYTSAAALLSYALTGQLAGMGKELWHLLFYQFLIVAYCSIIRLLLRKQEMIAAAIPILTLACVICCPVWIRLAVYLPVFRVLEKLFPVTYYLL